MKEDRDPRAVLTAYVDAFNDRDRQRWISLFAPDAEHVDPVGTPPRRGREQIAEFWDRAFSRAESIRIEPTIVIPAGHEAVMVAVVHSVQPTRVDELDAVDFFRFDGEGLITGLRAFGQLRTRRPRD